MFRRHSAQLSGSVEILVWTNNHDVKRNFLIFSWLFLSSSFFLPAIAETAQLVDKTARTSILDVHENVDSIKKKAQQKKSVDI